MKPLTNKEYKILIVNHKTHIHNSLNIILNQIARSSLNLKIMNAYSFNEAKKILDNNKDIALGIIDEDMKALDKGMNLIQYIREEIDEKSLRIIMTGEHFDFIDIDFMIHYDINDIKQKKQLSFESMIGAVGTALVEFEQLIFSEDKEAMTYKQMTTDPLTHLYNRVKLYEDCNLDREKILILIDIIGFSTINENYGHNTGDLVLKEFAAFLYSMYHDNFNVYHLDNDLFALVSMESTMHNIFDTVENIKNDIVELNIVTNNFNQNLDISIGVAHENEKNILRKAELALREARSLGLNKIEYYSQDLKILKKLNSINHWGPIIKNSLNKEGIIVHYQPIYDLSTNNIEKYELLIRIEHEGNLYFPSDFLDAAYQTGQTYDIFKYMFTAACAQAQKTALKFSVNIGDVDLEKGDVLNFITGSIATYNIDPTLLSIEILEYNAISTNSELKDKIIEIHKLGIGIIIDDFGVNCSNFGQMQNLPIDIIKIDGSFISNILESKNSQIVVKTIQTYAKEKNIKLVAEYVSSKDILNIVKALGIDYGQGYYLGEPQEGI